MSPVEISSDHNPLRSLDDRRLNRIAGPSGLIIFGVTGDLSRKKLMPAVYDLANRGLLPPGFGLVGFARRDWDTQDFEKVVHDAVKQYARTPFDENVWRQLTHGIRFVSGEFDDDDAFARLAETVADLVWGEVRAIGVVRAPQLQPGVPLPDPGSVTVRYGDRRVSIPLEWRGALEGPDLAWRLAQPLEAVWGE